MYICRSLEVMSSGLFSLVRIWLLINTSATNWEQK